MKKYIYYIIISIIIISIIILYYTNNMLKSDARRLLNQDINNAAASHSISKENILLLGRVGSTVSRHKLSSGILIDIQLFISTFLHDGTISVEEAQEIRDICDFVENARGDITSHDYIQFIRSHPKLEETMKEWAHGGVWKKR